MPIILLSGISTIGHSQHVLSHFEIPEQAQAGYEYLIDDGHDNLYIGFRVGTWIPAILGDTTLYGHRYDSATGLGHTDFHLVKYDTDYNLQSSFVIDNAEWIYDFYATEDNAFVSLTLFEQEQEDSLYPIVLGGEMEVQREGNRGKGVLVVLDEDLKLEKAVIPGTGELGQIVADGQYTYLEMRIPDNQEYILVGEDTVFNFRLDFPGMEFGFQTVVLCKYDLISEEVVWWKRIGNVGTEFLRDMLIDGEGNLLIHGWTSSGYFTFTELDTAINYQENKPFLAKYTPNGELLWGILNTNQHGELFHSIELDKEGNVYYIGEYTWPEYHVGDTVLFNEWYMPDDPTNRGLLIKYNRDGVYQWIHQIDGLLAHANLRDVSFHQGKIAIGGKFSTGSVLLGETIYENMDDSENTFVLVLNKHNGYYNSHLYENGPASKSTRHVLWDQEGHLHLYLWFAGEEEMFGENFKSESGGRSGFVVKLDLDSITNSTNDVHQSSAFTIFPNPVKAQSDLSIQVSNAKLDVKLSYFIYDMAGRIVCAAEADSQNSIYLIRISTLPPGYYTLISEYSDRRWSAILCVE